MSTTMPLISVLVVNDQIEMCELWQRIIDLTPGMNCPGYALSGEEAIQQTAEIEPDVVLMDVMMPGIGGLEATKRILAAQPNTLIIMYSAYTGTEAQAYEVGATEYLLMPVPPERLTQTIRRVYKQHRFPSK